MGGMTYSRWCGDADIRWTRGRAACLERGSVLGTTRCEGWCVLQL